MEKSPVPAEITASTPTTVQNEINLVSESGIQALTTSTELASATQVDIHLPGNPVWVAGIPYADGTAWAVALDDGSLLAYAVSANGYEEVEIAPRNLPVGMPLTIYASGGLIYALAPPGADAAPYSLPVLLDGGVAYLANNGELVIQQGDAETRLPVNALPDSRMLLDDTGRLLLLSQPTTDYAHAVLGDDIEATGITLVATQPEPKILQEISIPNGDVIEGIAPLWVDMNGDGAREIIVTLSNAREGARLIVFREDGGVLAQGEPIGTGYRWRHQLVAAPFGDSNEMLLAVVRTPHIGGVIEYYQLNGQQLEITESISGFSTHSIGSRNLFTAQAGDFDNDGKLELLLPDQSHKQLGIVGLDGEPVFWFELEAELATNLAAVEMPESGEVSIAAGLSNKTLRIWVSK